MALLNIFKKKSDIVKDSLEKQDKPLKKKETSLFKKAKSAEDKSKAKEILKKQKPAPQKTESKKHQAWRVLEAGQITEKAAFLAEKGKYVFKITQKATKMEVKKAVEGLFGVKVVKVNLITIPRKRKRLGRTQGWKKGYRKAILTLAKGQTIDLLPR